MEESTTEEASVQFGPPTTVDIVLPPVLFALFIFISMFILSLLTQPRWWRNRCCCCTGQNSQKVETIMVVPKAQGTPGWTEDNNSTGGKNGKSLESESFLTEEDHMILQKVEEFHNNPLALFIICLPVYASLAFCPLTILTFSIWMEFFWPPDITGPMTNINDAISCFLTPAGLVYAIAFGFAFQDVLSKRADIDKDLGDQMNLLTQTRQLLICADMFDDKVRLKVAFIIKEAIMTWMAQIPGCKRLNNKGNLWDAMRSIQAVKAAKTVGGGDKGILDDTIIKSLYDNLMKLDIMLTNGTKGERSIHFVQWLFLELLGFITFFGILMVKAESYRMELTMCIITVFSISAFSYILADLDDSYHGLFRTRLDPHVEFVMNLSKNLKPDKLELEDH